jgi:glucose-6-phosphate isomerase
MKVHFLDNTDPDGIDRVLGGLTGCLERTLTLVVSKSGGTAETRNGMMETAAVYDAAGLDFGRHAVAITGEGSKLERFAREHDFLEVFPMWDWVGGRTSELCAVGLLPAALQGIDIGEMLAGAALMDCATRLRDVRDNPAALLALAWFHAGEGRGVKDMVILPYKDRLLLLSRYLQQLVMESLGKARDLDGRLVNQGIVVYGNKGSTDQHAYVQQLREGPADFFATFIQVLRDRKGESIEIENGVTSGDFLQGFLLGTRRALYEKGRTSLTITIDEVGPRTIGMLIAMYERAVGLYAHMININAYHQPGVEAGKKAAAAVLELQKRLLAELGRRGIEGGRCDQLAAAVGADDDPETAFQILERLSSDPGRNVVRVEGASPFDAVYRLG